MTKIITKNSSTGGAAPATSDLVQGELAVNVTDKKLYTKNSSGVVIELGPTSVATANALTTARAISLSGGVTGTVNFDGSAPVNIVAAVNFASNNPTATDNVTLGANAGAGLTSGTGNTFIGADAAPVVTSATSNTSIGNDSLLLNITGAGNTAIGNSALNKATANFNTGVGYIAGNALTTGVSNTFVGDSAGSNITTGQGNVNIGNQSNASSATVSHEVTLGSSSITALRCNVQSISALSDARDKTNIADTPYGVDFINTLQPRQFTWATREGSPKDGKVEQGFIAQELLEAAGVDKDKLNLVYESNPDRLEATVGNLIPILVKAIQELSARVTELENN